MKGKMIKEDFQGNWHNIEDCALGRFAKRALSCNPNDPESGWGDYDCMYARQDPERIYDCTKFRIVKVTAGDNVYPDMQEPEFLEIKAAFEANPDLEVTLYYKEVRDKTTMP